MSGNNKYSWNETLKFSWGHIIAFVALIFLSYVTYMGEFYSNGGDFKSSAIKVCLIDVALLITFIGAQIFKGTDERFDRSIIVERILICLCPIVFVLAMIPFNHFWIVFSNRDKVEPTFTSAIEKSRQMFINYDKYSKDRIIAYSESLFRIISNKENNKEIYLRAGFGELNDDIVMENYIKTLKLQLLSQNTDSLRVLASNWINEANQGASVWNAFLVGNIEMISEAIEEWNQKLYEVSIPVLSNERLDSTHIVSPFDEKKESFKAANRELSTLRDLFINSKGISLYTIIIGSLLFLMLLFPYFLQKRNTRANGLYYLIPKIKTVIPMHNNTEESKEEGIGGINSFNKQFSDDIYSGTF